MMNKVPIIRKIIVYALYIFLVTGIQVSFSSAISFRGQTADLMLVFVVLVSYFYGFLDGAVVGILTGILRDFYAAPSIVGIDKSAVPSACVGVLVLFILSVASSSFFTERLHRNTLFAFASITFCTLLYKIGGHIVIRLWLQFIAEKSYNLTLKQIILDSILPQLMLNLIAGIPLILLLRFLGPYKKGVNPVLIDEKTGGESLWLTM